MNRYVNSTGGSIITHYEIGDDFICIQYKKERLVYSTSNNSKEDIEGMKVLAKAGTGLYRYIMINKIKQAAIVKKEGIYQKIKLMFSF